MGNAGPALDYVVHSLNPGGTERLVVQMSLAFAEEFDVRVLCLDEPGLWARDLRAQGIPVHGLWRQAGMDTGMPAKIARYCRSRGTRIVHAHQYTPWLYAALARLLCPKPALLFEEHGRFYPEVENRRRAWTNRTVVQRLTHRMVAVSNDVRARLQRYEGLNASRIEVIYNGVKQEAPLAPAARLQLRKELGFAPESFVVGTVGRLDPIKNLPLLVRSVALASELEGTLRGLIVGDGPMFADIGSLIEESGLSGRVRLAGFRDDARKVIQCLDLFILASFSEGTSMALLEAMAAGVAVAVTDVGGNPEIVVNDETGWVVASDSVEDMTRAILESIRDGPKRTRFAQAGKRRFDERFTLERMIEAYRRSYLDLLAIR